MECIKLAPGEARGIYDQHLRRDFPRSEVKPFAAILDMMGQGKYECLGFYEDEGLRGYAFMVLDREGGYFLLDYLAVCTPCRGHGYGGRILKGLRERYRDGNGILIECEDPRTSADAEELAARHRRLDFYFSNGCFATGCRTEVYGVEYSILYLPLKEARTEYADKLAQVYRQMFTERAMQKHVRLQSGVPVRKNKSSFIQKENIVTWN